MKDYEFGTKIYELRKAESLSQNKLAEMLGVSNKAVSKWENGNAKPSIEQLLKLAKIFNVSVEDLVETKKKEIKHINKIVITGGPCSGKSTALSWLQTEFSKKGYLVLFVPESASELIIGGVAPWTIDTNLNFETAILKLQIMKEQLFEEAAKNSKFDKILLVCDRGCLDCKAYMTQNEYARALKTLNLNEIQLRDSYDAVFHLVTAAKGAEEYYTLANNQARLETAEEAKEKDSATMNAWVGHPHLRVIDNSTNFEKKMQRLMKEISRFLGEPEPCEIERKFLIEYPNLEALEKLPNCQKVDIIQTYLKTFNGEETRIRQRGLNGNFIYTKTTKKKLDGLKRLEVESRISKDEYIKLLLDADTTKKQIRKTRYCLMYKNQYYEIDIYPFWKDKAIMEIELRDEKQTIKLPEVVKVIKEVTDDETFFNIAMATKG